MTCCFCLSKFPNAHCKFQVHLAGLEVCVTVCTNFQAYSSYSLAVMVPKVIFDVLAPSDPKTKFYVDSAKTF